MSNLPRAVRVVRALALGGGLVACGSEKSTSVSPASVDATGSDAQPDTRLDRAEAGDASGGGHCQAPDDDAAVNCPPTTACSTDELGAPVCVVPPEDFDAGIQPCGSIGCNRTGSCFCANEMTSFCVCSTSVGPLAPPDLPAV